MAAQHKKQHRHEGEEGEHHVTNTHIQKTNPTPIAVHRKIKIKNKFYNRFKLIGILIGIYSKKFK